MIEKRKNMIVLKKYSLIVILFSFSITIIAQNNNYLNGKINYDKGLYNSAIASLDKFIMEQHNKDEAFVIRGKAKLNLNQYNSAIDDFLKVNKKKFPEINLLLSRAYAAVNNEKEAIRFLKNYLKLKDKLPEEQLIAFVKAHVYVELDRREVMSIMDNKSDRLGIKEIPDNYRRH